MTIIEHETTVQPELDIEVGQWRMDPSLKQRWVTALRSGKYEQGAYDFEVNDKFCVLGVLCDVAGQPTHTPHGGGNWGFVDSALGSDFAAQIAANRLFLKNDHGWTFDQLADYIEENY